MLSVILQLGCPSSPLGVAGNAQMHVSPQGHCGYLDFAHALRWSAEVDFLTTVRFSWNYPQMRTVRPPNIFTFADVTKESTLPLRAMEISSQTISFAAHITLLRPDFFFLISKVSSGLVAKFSGSFRQLWAVRLPSSKVEMKKRLCNSFSSRI